MIKYATFLLALVILAFTAAVCAAQDRGDHRDATTATQESGKDASFWMEQKLRLSTDILAGLAESDFQKIGEAAERMRGINRVESFVRRGPEGYRDELRLFNAATNKLISAVADENLEAATLAFHRLTTSCVGCHQQLRRGD